MPWGIELALVEPGIETILVTVFKTKDTQLLVEN